MWFVVYILIVLAAGYAVVGWFDDSQSPAERFGLCMCLGSGVLGLCLIGLSMAGVRPSRIEISLLAAAFIAIDCIVFRRRRIRIYEKAGEPPIYLRFWAGICLAAIGYGVLVQAKAALVLPVTEWDAFAIWQLKAKALATNALRPEPAYFFDNHFAYSHQTYPLLMPMMSASIHALTGNMDDRLAKTPSLLMFVGLGAVVCAGICKRTGPIAAITATAILLNLPVFYRYGCSGTADMALTAFFACATICILNWLRTGRWGDLILAAIFSACAAWTKNEGMALASIFGLVVIGEVKLGRRKSVLQACVFIAVVVALFAPWHFYLRGIPVTNTDFSLPKNPRALTQSLVRLPVVLRAIEKEFINLRHWGVFWIGAVALQAVRWTGYERRTVVTLWSIVALQLMAYISAYLATAWNIYDLLPITLERLLMQASPVVAILIGLLLPNAKDPQPMNAAIAAETADASL